MSAARTSTTRTRAKRATRHFTPELFAFLRELAANNDREWFQANKERYETVVKEPAMGFIGDFGAPLSGISKHFVADPRPVGGSLLRIYRDTRFAKDKTPYKTMVGIQFRHEVGKDIHAPGFYLHLDPGSRVRCSRGSGCSGSFFPISGSPSARRSWSSECCTRSVISPSSGAYSGA